MYDTLEEYLMERERRIIAIRKKNNLKILEDNNPFSLELEEIEERYEEDE